MKQKWTVMILTVCLGIGILLPAYAQERNRTAAETDNETEKITQALYSDFNDDVKEWQGEHTKDAAEQAAGQCIHCGSFDIRYKMQHSYYERTAACMHGYRAGNDIVRQNVLVRYAECQMCGYQEYISDTTTGSPYIECHEYGSQSTETALDKPISASEPDSPAESGMPEETIRPGKKVQIDDERYEEAINELNEYIDKQLGKNGK